MGIKKEKRRSKNHRAVFLDRDGVINRALINNGKPYPPTNFNEFNILPHVVEACKKLKEAGYMLVVATNQPDVGRGTLSQNVVEEMHAFLLKNLSIDRVEVCYHPGRGPSNCDCRKPLPGMLLRASQELRLDLSESWMVGDRFRDIMCGQAAGCRTILVGGGYNEESPVVPDFRASNLAEAVAKILSCAMLGPC